MTLQTERHIVEAALRSFAVRLLQLPKLVEDKGGDLGPLTDLDTYVDRALSAAIHTAFRDDGWISEESPHQSSNGRYWIVDPVDGTREIVAGIPEWAVSVGLWQDGRPLYGWLYNAQRGQVWHGGPGLGAWADDRPVSVTIPKNPAAALVGISRTDIKKGLVPKVEPEPKAIGSIAFKLGLVAIGELDATVSVTPKNIWDIAGGIAIVLGAGGAVIQFSDGKPMNCIDDIHALQEGGLVAAHPSAVEAIRKLYGAQS